MNILKHISRNNEKDMIEEKESEEKKSANASHHDGRRK